MTKIKDKKEQRETSGDKRKKETKIKNWLEFSLFFFVLLTRNTVKYALKYLLQKKKRIKKKLLFLWYVFLLTLCVKRLMIEIKMSETIKQRNSCLTWILTVWISENQSRHLDKNDFLSNYIATNLYPTVHQWPKMI